MNENRPFLILISMVVTWWNAAFLHSVSVFDCIHYVSMALCPDWLFKASH